MQAGQVMLTTKLRIEINLSDHFNKLSSYSVLRKVHVLTSCEKNPPPN